MVKAPLSPAPLALAAGLALQACLSPAAAQPVWITGRVTPAAARVELHSAHPALEERLRRLGGAEPAPLASAKPRPDGSFEIAAPGPGFYRVVLRAEGLVPLETRLVPLLEPEALAPARLTRGAPLEVLVLGPSGAPEKGIEVRAMGYRKSAEGEARAWSPVEVRGVTGEDGRVSLPRRRGDRMLVSVVTPRFVEWLENDEGTSATLRLRQRPVRVVEVLSPDGRPAPGILVSLDASHPLGVTGPGGRLALPVLDQGTVELLLEGPGGLSTTLGWPAPGDGPVTATLASSRLATGRVVDALTAKPLPGALVWLSGQGAQGIASTFAGAAGDFELRLPYGLDSSIAATAGGYLDDWQTVPPAAGPEKTALLLKLAPSATLAGVTVDESGRPVAGAWIEAELSDLSSGATGGLGARARSGPDGRFSLSGLAAGAGYELRATHESFTPAVVSAAASAPGRPAPAARIVFSAGWSATGRVVDEEGRPVAGASLSLIEVERRSPDERRPGGATSDASGRFQLRHLPPRELDLIVRAPDFGPLRVPGLAPPASGAPVLDLGDITLPAGVAIEGRVTDHRGRPVAEARVGLMQVSSSDRPWLEEMIPPAEVTTGPDGRFRLPGLRQGERYGVWARHQGHASASLPGVEAPTAEPLRIELRPARVLAGRVVGPAGEPVPHASLNDFEERGVGQGGEISSYGHRWGSFTQADAQGRFRADGLEPGSLNLEVSAPGYKTRLLRGVVIPEESDVENLEIALERGATLTGRVLDGRGEPVTGAHVSASRVREGTDFTMDISRSVSSETDGEGRYRLGGLDPGRHRITANLFSEDRRAEAETVVHPGDNVLNLTFRRTTEVSGRVVDESGEPVPGVSVSLGGSRDAKGVRSGPGGLFHFPAVEDGEYALSGAGPGFAGPAEPVAVEVDGRPVRGLELRLRRGGTLLTGLLLGLAPGELERVSVSAGLENDPLGRPATVGRDGTYRVAGLAPGTWQVSATLDSGRHARGSIRLEPGQERAVLDLEVTSGLALTGRVLADGVPLAGVQILLSRQRSRGAEATTVHDGRFRLEGLEPGAYVLLAAHSASGLGTAQAVDLPRDRDLLVEIASGTVRGQVALAPGEPAAGLGVFLEWSDPALGVSFLGPAVQTDDQGSFEVPRVAAGHYPSDRPPPGTPVGQGRGPGRAGAGGDGPAGGDGGRRRLGRGRSFPGSARLIRGWTRGSNRRSGAPRPG